LIGTVAAVRIRAHVIDGMIGHARADAPRECCGLLIGCDGLIDEYIPVPNIDPDPTRRYLLDPAGHVAILRQLRGSAREIVGCYHSHPHSPAAPSESDRAEAYYPDFTWIIVSLEGPEPDVAAFRIAAGGSTSVPMAVERPAAGESNPDEERS
jgi:proteasome lid subunit RPN8/RPN11